VFMYLFILYLFIIIIKEMYKTRLIIFLKINICHNSKDHHFFKKMKKPPILNNNNNNKISPKKSYI